jgi:elongation factor P
MASINEVKSGNVIKYNKDNYAVDNVEFRKPGKGGAFYQLKLRNLLTGSKAEHKFRSGETVEIVRIERHAYQYLYKDGEAYAFMNNDTYDQVTLQKEMVGDQYLYMKENDNVSMMFEGEKILSVEIPAHVNLAIAHTEPGVKGDTATNVMKPATLETGAKVSVPLFINEGDKIRVDTSLGTYIERVKS